MSSTSPVPRSSIAVRPPLRPLLAVVVAALCLALGAQAASAAELYLSPGGVNAGNCQIETQPCSSVNYVQSQASVTPGPDTVHLAAGDYLPDISYLTVPNVAWVGPQAGVPADEQTGPTARVGVPSGGFAFVVQADGISFDGLTFQSASYGASDGAFAIYNTNPTIVRNAVFTHVQTGLYAGAGIILSGASFDTSGDAMYVTGNAATISNARFSPPSAYAGLVSGANGALTVTDSNFTGGTYGLLTYAGSPPVTLTGNRFSPSIPNGLYNDGSTVDARDNWWGCNTGPNTSGCAVVTGPGAGTTTTAPYLRLSTSATPDPVDAGASAVVTGALDRNSAGDPVAVDFPGSTVAFGTSYGTLDRTSAPLTGGAATATLTAPSAGGTADVTAALDNATAHLPLVVSDVPPTIAVAGDVTTTRSGTTVAVSGAGNPGSTVQVQVNGVPVGVPITVASDGTWLSSVTIVDGDNALRAVQGSLVADGPTVVGVYAPTVGSPQPGDAVRADTTVHGTGIAGATVDVADEDGTAIGSATVGSGGDFSVDLDPLTLGPHTLHVTQTTGGVTSSETTVAVTTVPDPPVLTRPVDGDSLTAGVVRFVGTARPNASVNVETALGTSVASGLADDSGAFDLSSTPLAEGTYSFVADQTSAGVTSPATAPIAVTLTVPAPTIAADRRDALSGTTVHVSGTGFAGAALQIRNNGTPVGATTVAADGSWSADVTVGDGANDLDVVQDGTRTSPVVTVEGHAGPKVALPSPNAHVRPTFSMRGDSYASTEITVTDEHGSVIGRATPTGCDCWSLRTSVPLDDGPHTLTISQTVDGTVRSSTLAVVVDPQALEVTAPVDQQPVLADGLRFTGSGAPGATIRIYVGQDDTPPVATGTADEDGRFDVPATIAAGFADVSVTQTPVGGSESDPIELGLILLLNPPTVSIDGPTTVAEGDAIALSGSARPNAHIVLYDNGTAITDVVADADGDWTGALPALAGDNAIAAAQVVVDGNPAFSYASDETHAIGVGAPQVSAPEAGDHVQATFDLSGTALPGATVTIADGTTTLATATADAATGVWSTTTTTPLAYGDHALAVRQRLDGVAGADLPVAVAVVPSAPTLTHPDGSEVGDGSIPVAGTADASATVDVFLDDGSAPVASTTANGDGDFSTSFTAPPGAHAVRVSQRVGTSLSGPLSAARSVQLLPARPTLQLDSAETAAAGDPVTVSGHADPGATVLVDREAPAGVVRTFTTVADGLSGAWSTTFPAAGRTNAITARQQPFGVGATSLPSRPPVVVTATPVLAPPSFTMPSYARTGALTIAGTARPGATVSGTFDGHAKSTTADDGGAWSIDVTVHAGAQSATFQQAAVVDGGAEASDDSAPQTITGVAAPTVTAPAEDDRVDATLTVAGTALPNATVAVEDGSGGRLASVTAGANGEYSAPVSLPDIGTYALTATQERGGVTSEATVVHVRFPPAAPAFDAPHGFVTGPVHLRGTARAGAAISVYDGSGSVPVATGTTDDDGTYDVIYTPPTGTHRLTVTQTAAGLESAPGPAHDVTAWPTPLTVGADAAVVPLGSATTLSGDAMPGATVVVSANGATLDSTTADPTTGRWSDTLTLPAGVHALEVVQEIAGDRGEPVAGPTVTVLDAPTIAAVTGPVDTTLVLSGTAPPNVTVRVRDEHDQLLGSTTSDGSGAWSLTTTTALVPGDHVLTARARLDGVDGPASADLAVSVRPAAPVMTTPSSPAATSGAIRFRGTAVPGATVTAYDTGSGLSTVLASGTADEDGAYDFSVYVAPASYAVAVGQVVGSAPPSVLSAPASVSVALPAPTVSRSGATVRVGDAFTVGGGAWPAATVRISVDGGAVETATADADGHWSAELTATAGDQSITAVQRRFDTDSPASDPVSVLGLAPPTIATPSTGTTVGQRFALSGSGEPGATITVRDAESASIGSDTVSGGGSWSVTTTTALGPGTRSVSVEQTLDGTTSAVASRSVEVQPPAPSLTTPGDGDRAAGRVRFSGTALPGAVIDVQDGATSLTAVATADGSGAFSGSVALGVGTHTVTVSQRIDASVASEPTAARTLTVLPDAPSLSGPAEATTGAEIALTGTARPHATIAVLRGGTPIATTPGTVTADGDGRWTASVTAVEGDDVLTATQTSDALESPASSALHVTGVGGPVVATPAAGARVGPTFTLAGTGVAGATVTAKDGSTVLGSATVGGDGRWSLTTTAGLDPGSRTLTLTMRTAGGTTGTPITRTFAVVPAAPTATAADGTSPVTVSGHALVGAAVTVSEGTTVVATGTAGGDGGFAIPVPLAPGAHRLTVTQRGHDGGDSDPSAPVTVTVSPPVVPPTTTDAVPTSPTTGAAPPTPTTPVGPPSTPAPPSNAFTIARKSVGKTRITLTLKLPGAGRVTVTATIKGKHKGKRVTYSTAKATPGGPTNAQRLVLKPGRKAKAALGKRGTVRVTITVTFTPTGGKPASTTSTVSVKGGRHG